MSFDFDSTTVHDLQQSASKKWGEFPGELCMWVAEMDFGLAPAVAESIRQWADNVSVGYTPGDLNQRVADAAAAWYSDTFHTELPARELTNVPNVLSAFDLALARLVEPGTPVIVPTPAYMPFLTLPLRFGHPVIQVPSIDDAGVQRFDLDAIDAAFKSGAQMLILVNPANPTGRVYSRSELEAISEIVSRHDGRVFVDEIHAPLALDAQFVPYASLSQEARDHSITAFAPTKGWNMPGLKIAHLRLSNPDDEERLQPVLNVLADLVPTPGLSAALAAYTEGREWNQQLNRYLTANRDYFEAEVATIPGIDVNHSEGTYISWLDFRGLRATGRIPEGTSPAQWMHTYGLALTPGELLGEGYEDFARMIIASPRHILEQGVGCLRRAATS
ncbi:MAG: aminotransferase class I/II-fold pyridoxal phosphate-dependent enzyme [Actinomycetaceae bacterium]|nr:aminotransferase class I/II-fold pyridoxal phosphate-dependent enzyme [Arcanobacterium sp.]MDD7504712.1 aminotransferase class I/II-fold pyridoxal phosphate-dependent enzyme [Actinomycetaceae bacterium]MDY6143113.1 aminotransferase class I/II-fold pyridoxal phosphate-dependent enzyme [Arcanobacterium sp.]